MKDKKFEKRKKREVKVQKKLLTRRLKEREKTKEEREANRFSFKERERCKPIVKDANADRMAEELERREVSRIERSLEETIREAEMCVIKAKDKNMSDTVINRLEDNYQILLSLKDEFVSENAARDSVNRELDEKGIATLKEKMEYLSSQAIDAQKEAALLEDSVPYVCVDSDNT